MDERIMQFRVGVMVLATLLITGMLVMLFHEFPSFMGGTYIIHMRFREAPGVTVDTPVRKSGILIGRVTQVEFDEQTPDVWVTASVASNRIYKSEHPRISASLLGDAAIEFVGRGPQRVTDLISNGERFENGEVIPPASEMFSKLEARLLTTAAAIEATGAALSRTSDSIAQTSNEWRQVGQRVNSLLGENEEQVKRLVTNADKTLQSLDAALTSANRLIGDEQLNADLRRAMSDLPKTLDDARKALTSIHQAAGSVQQLSQDVGKVSTRVSQSLAGVDEAVGSLKRATDSAERNFKNIEALTAPLAENGDQLARHLNGSVAQLEAVLGQLSHFSRQLNSREGTVGQLLHNPELYNNLNAAIANINRLSYDLRPIIQDARVFTDKIARHPELIGVRGAMTPSSGIK